MTEEKFRCIEQNCDGELVEIEKMRKDYPGYSILHYMCRKCSKEFYRADYPQANLDHERKQSLINRVGQT